MLKNKWYLTSLTVSLALISVAGLAQACNEEPTIGSVCVFAMDWCPRGYMKADGTTLQVNTNQAIFSLIGFRYGGNNTNLFQLPDLRGRSVAGTGQAPDLTSAVTIAQKIGQQTVVLTPAQTPVQPHIHPAALTPVFTSTQINIPATTGNLDVKASLPVAPGVGNITGPTVGLTTGTNGYLAGVSGTTGVDPVTFSGPYTTAKPGNPAYLEAAVKVNGNASTAAGTTTVQAMTGGTVTVGNNPAIAATMPVATQSPALGMTVCIAVQGLYPSRPD